MRNVRFGVAYGRQVRVTERSAFLYLLRHSGRRWAEISDEVEDCGSAIELLPKYISGQRSRVDMGPSVGIDETEAEIGRWEREGISLATVLDDTYPAQLQTIHQRPPFVTWRGSSDPADARGVAIVGSREASPSGLRQAETLAKDLAELGVSIISGLAQGVDTAAHTGALKAGGRTVAVLGAGLRRAYPSENAALQEEIAHRGMVLSQFLPDAPATKRAFPMRDATMSGYAAATVVMEAGWRSGARMQARLALEHGRRVFLMRSLLRHDWAQEYAGKPGVVVVDVVDDVAQQLRAISRPREDLVWA